MLLLRRQCIIHSQRVLYPLRPASRDIWTTSARLRRRTSEPGGGRNRWLVYPATILGLSGLGYLAYNNSKPFKHTVLAIIRCARVGEAAVLGAIDYKWTFAGSVHTRSAKRVLKALLANGGVFIKLGQHMEWTSTMRPLQDQCEPTPYENLEGLFLSDMGASIDELFADFDPNPIGVASLAQVHVGHHKASGKRVAVKLQHPHLAEFCDIDMAVVEVALGWIKYWFPEFEFTWLGEEMRENLPKEMDFVHEATNARKTANDFKNMRTSLYIPEVIVAKKRVLIMEYIQGARVDDLEYLADANIDRNKVALELSRIFNQMIFINGWFHAVRNLLIRPAPQTSKSPYNFEVVLLDHGLYFDLDTPLRVNYGKFWLSLFAPASESANADRRKYAQLVGNVGPDLYPIFEAAMTGRAAGTFERASDMMSISRQTEEGRMFASILHVLRHVPRRVLMVLKVRIFLVMAKYCIYAVWQDDRLRVIDSIRDRGLFSIGLFFDYFRCWWYFVESVMDIQAHSVITRAWIRGLLT
ncbi:ABC1-domain-containing protein [Armillaria novae-zelandiae]|uniref:ABC1-domain-containing protein n=1 Tax=Armillaria novae-zelandiae TaxID=153914 RepID=A0AA39TFK0_9AGAR|nr:ABC1-domain-containing protein [Armillaria novae-zelandiae]